MRLVRNVGSKPILQGLTISTLVKIIVSSALAGIAMSLFINGNFYSGGLYGIVLYLTDLLDAQSAFTVIFYIVNLPLLIFGFLKVGRRFTLLTLLWVIMTPLFSTLFGPEMLDIMPGGDEISAIANSIVGAIIYATAIVMMLKAGGSTGGTDFITVYASIKYGKSIGKMAATITYVIIATGQIALAFKYGFTNFNEFFELVINDKLVYTLIYVAITGQAIDRLYPKSTKVAVNVITTKTDAIIKHLKDINYNHGATIKPVIGARQGDKKDMITFICWFMEKHDLIKEIGKVDPNIFVTVYKLSELQGNFKLQGEKPKVI